MTVVIVIVGIVVVLIGLLNLIRPDVAIAFRNEWARFISRPFLHGRLLGGGMRSNDPLQRLISRLSGLFFIIVGIGVVVAGLLANNR